MSLVLVVVFVHGGPRCIEAQCVWIWSAKMALFLCICCSLVWSTTRISTMVSERDCRSGATWTCRTPIPTCAHLGWSRFVNCRGCTQNTIGISNFETHEASPIFLLFSYSNKSWCFRKHSQCSLTSHKDRTCDGRHDAWTTHRSHLRM